MLSPLGDSDEAPGDADVEGVWFDAAGNPTYEHDDSGTRLTLHVFQGAKHCGWQSALFMTLAWPLGSVERRFEDDTRQYVRDPEGILTDSLIAPYEADVATPQDGAYTGFHRGNWQLWTSVSDLDEAVYVVNAVTGVTERWTRSLRPILCK